MFNFPTLILLLNTGVFIVGVLLIAKVFPFRQRLEVRWLLAMTAALAIISFCSLNVYVQGSLEDKIFFSRLRYLGFATLGPCWFFFLVFTYSRRSVFRRPWLPIVTLLPGLTTIGCALIPRWQHWLTKDYALFHWRETALVTFTTGSWFPVHIVSANFLAIGAILFMLSTLRGSTGVKRKQLLVLIFGGTTSLLIDIYCVATDSPLRWAMLSSGTFLITEAAILYAIERHGLLNLAPIAKNWIFKEIPDPVVILDDQDRVMDFNRAAGSIFKITTADRGLAWTGARHPGNIAIEAEGRLKSYEVHAIALDSRRSMAGKIIFFRDVSAQKEIEEKLNGDLEFKARLLTLIAHDFSAMLQTQSYLSSHLHKEVQPELRREAGALTSISFASQDLMTNILRWSRAQEKQFARIRRPFEVNILIKDVINNLEAALLIKDLSVEFQSQQDPFIFDGDSMMIESVFRNLLTNAIRASSPQKQIRVYLTIDQTHLRIAVEDEGLGMSAKQLNAIQERNEGEESVGFGVGLLIARRFVEIHHGFLEFKSQEAKGTSVTLSLPFKEPGG